MSYYHDPETNPFHAQGGANGFMYWGDRAGWSIVDSINYDPSALDRANFESLARACGYQVADTAWDDRPDLCGTDSEDCAVENYSGAAGKGQFLLVRPGSDAERIAYELHAQLSDYPCLDEELWSELESEESTEAVAEALRYEWSDGDGDFIRSLSDDERRDIASFFCANIPNGDDSFYIDNWPDFRRDLGDSARDSFHTEDRQILAVALREWRIYNRRKVA